MANLDDDIIGNITGGSGETPSGWLVEIVDDVHGNMILGFKSEAEGRAAFNALKVAFVLGEGGILTLQNRDENENWLVIETADLE